MINKAYNNMTKNTIILILLLLGQLPTLFSQTTARERIEQRRKQAEERSLTPANRVSQLNIIEEENIANARWSRIIYRYIDLSKVANEPLYYPVVPTAGKSNLFTQIFRLLQQDQIRVYEYLDGHEDFTEEYRIRFPELLKRFDIYHTTVNGVPEVDDADIPSNEVVGYYIKEAYYIDDASTSLRVRPMALCPILLRHDEYASAATRYPLFWVPYSELAPYTRQMPLMGTALNNSANQSVDDFFRKRNYDGEIYKTGNPGSRAIAQYTSSPEEMKAEQERIEQELRNFEQLIRGESKPKDLPKQQQTRSSTRRSSNTTTATGSRTMRNRRY